MGKGEGGGSLGGCRREMKEEVGCGVPARRDRGTVVVFLFP